MNTKKKRILSNYYLNFTMVFCILFICCFFWFKIYGKSFFRTYDGLDQHYLIFLYMGKWFRKVFRNIFVLHTFTIPMWDMSMGYGSDIFPTLGMYFPDPFNWISAFFPAAYAEFGFNFSLFLKFYFTGIAFSYFGFHKGYQKSTVLLGSVLYTFCATMYIAFIQAPFINPMYIFPFLIVGIDKIFKHESPKVYILALGFSFINYFYFAYMMCVFAVGYCVLYYFTTYEESKSIKNCLTWVFKYILYSIVAFCLSMAVLLPILGMLIGQHRLSTNYYLPAFYDHGYYKSLFLGFLSSFSMSGRDAIVGFGAITIFGIGYLFSQKKRFIKEKIQFIVLTIILCIPAFGSIMNGFSYYANRWVWAYCLCVVNIVCLTLPEYKDISRTFLYKISLFLIAYFGITSLFIKGYSSLLITTLFLVLAICLFIYKAHDFTVKTFQRGLIVFAMICVTVQSYYWFSIDYGNATSPEVEAGTALEKTLNGSGIPVLSDISRNEGSRFDECAIPVARNASWISEVYGSDLYISLYNDNVVNFHNSLALNTSAAPQSMFGLNRRSELEYLMGTKYYLIPEGKTSLLPVGYTQLDRTQTVDGRNISRYSNPNAVPMIFGYHQSINNKVYDALRPYERQQLLMKACVTENSENLELPVLPQDDIKYTEEIPRNIIKNTDGTYTVNDDGAEMILRIPEIRDSEVYVYFENIGLVQDKIDMTSGFSIYVKAQYDGNDIPDVSDTFAPRTNRTHMSAGKDDWMVNLGYMPDRANTIIVRFNQKGTYRFNSLNVYAKPVSQIRDSLMGLERVTDNLQIETNKLTATIRSENSHYIYIAVPYSKGWKAELNGKPVKIEKANGAFMAIKAAPGEYELRMTFVTPYLVPGIFLSLLSVVIIFVIEQKYRKRCVS